MITGDLPPPQLPASEEERVVPGLAGRWFTPEEARAATEVRAEAPLLDGTVPCLTAWRGVRRLRREWLAPLNGSSEQELLRLRQPGLPCCPASRSSTWPGCTACSVSAVAPSV